MACRLGARNSALGVSASGQCGLCYMYGRLHTRWRIRRGLSRGLLQRIVLRAGDTPSRLSSHQPAVTVESQSRGEQRPRIRWAGRNVVLRMDEGSGSRPAGGTGQLRPLACFSRQGTKQGLPPDPRSGDTEGTTAAMPAAAGTSVANTNSGDMPGFRPCGGNPSLE